MQHEVLKTCDCFHTELDTSLMDVGRFDYAGPGGQRPCNMAKPTAPADNGTEGEGEEENVRNLSDAACVRSIIAAFDSRTKECLSCRLACW